MLVMLFPGQGSQYPGMAKKLYDNHREVKKIFEQASDLLHIDCTALCFDSDEDLLRDVRMTGTAVFLAGYVRFITWSSIYGIWPDMAAGHSVGELTALAASGFLSFSDALNIVHKRGQILYDRTVNQPGRMMALRGLEQEQIETCLSEAGCASVFISCYNSLDQIVIAGAADELNRIQKMVEERGARTVLLKTGAAFHTPLMCPANEQVHRLMDGVKMDVPKFPVISSTTAAPHLFTWNIAHVLGRQVVEPVRWLHTMQTIQEYPVQFIVDMGPGAVTVDLAYGSGLDADAFLADRMSETDIAVLRRKLGGKGRDNSYSPHEEFIDLCILHIVALKNECRDDVRYTEDVTDTYTYLSGLRGAVSENPLSQDEVWYLLKRVEKAILAKSAVAGRSQFDKLLLETGLTGHKTEISRANEQIRQNIEHTRI